MYDAVLLAPNSYMLACDFIQFVIKEHSIIRTLEYLNIRY